MPRKTKTERFAGEHFAWRLSRRAGVFQADGRINEPSLGRFSLGTRDRSEAIRELQRLDHVMAVKVGKIVGVPSQNSTGAPLPLERGQSMYLEYVGRPPSLRGACAKTVQRYGAVLNKFVRFAKDRGLLFWNQVDAAALVAYVTWLDKTDYNPRTQAFEVAALKSAVKWLISGKHVPAVDLSSCQVAKPKGTTRYCYTPEEVAAMLDLCERDPSLHWLRDVIVVLSATGMRIREVAELRWDAVDLEGRMITLKDARLAARLSDRKNAPTTKSKRDRRIPLHRDVVTVLNRLGRTPDGYVFHGPRVGRLKPDTVLKILKRDVLTPLAKRFPKKGGKGVGDGVVHSFRHFFTSQGADSAASELMLMSWLGHADSEMVRHYFHARRAQALEQIDRLPSLLDSAERGATASGSRGPISNE